jgi:predicted DNA-binding transcriptional regulator AlpA
MRLAGIKEIANYYEISSQLAYKWTRRREFPSPVADLAQGKVWNFDDVEEWGERNGRTKGCGPRRRVAQ